MMMMRSLLVLAAATSICAACIEVSGDRILVGDVARVKPALEPLPADTLIGYSPLPGSERIVTAREIRVALRRQDIPDFGEVCVVRRTRELKPDEVATAMRAELKDPNIRIELLDLPKGPMLDGDVEFRKAGLPVNPARTDVVWRGRIITDTGRSFPISARVRLLRTVDAAFARAKITPALPVPADAIETRRIEVYALASDRPPTSDQIIGAELTHALRAGEMITASFLRAQPSVRRGDPLVITARSGSTSLRFDATAEGTGRIGDRMLVRNPLNGRLVRVLISERGKGTIDVRK